MEADLNANAKAYFEMDLDGFVRHQIEVEGVWDYEVADMLKIKQSHIGVMRRRLRIDRTKGFSGRFDRKYGCGAVARFKEAWHLLEKGGETQARYS
ncbi:MAG: hypothetical protein GY846_23035 [Deltaproteobacteria bacterium]|nr:hypothetical protein [Deltaproteobacteria bacterium]